MVEHVKYTILKKIDDLEIRKYPKMIVVSTTDNQDNSAFNHLFNYISGNNKSKEKVSMTSPVISSKKIPMTSPVISKENYMAFSLPQEFNMESAPTPTNPDVKLEEITEKILAVIRFSGITTEESIKKHSEILKKRVKEEELQVHENIMLFRYNSPFMPGFLRRNELAVELIEYKE